MASVQELILAAQAKQRPRLGSQIAQLIDAGSSGYTEGVKQKNVNAEADLRRSEIAKNLIAQKQAEDELAAQKELRNQFQEKLNMQSEQNLRAGQAATAKSTPPPTPAGKFEESWSQDANGKISRSIKEVSPKQAEIPQGYRSTADGNMEYIPGGPADPRVKAAQRPEIDKYTQKAIADAKVDLATTRPMVDSVTKEIERVQELNKDSYGGVLGNIKMKALSAADAGASNTTFKNTSDVLNTMQAQVSRVLKSTFGGQLSDGERQYLNQVYGALPNMSRTERDVAMTNVKTMLTNRLKASQSKLDELSLGAGLDVPDAQSTTSALSGGKETPEQRKARLIQELQGATK